MKAQGINIAPIVNNNPSQEIDNVRYGNGGIWKNVKDTFSALYELHSRMDYHARCMSTIFIAFAIGRAIDSYAGNQYGDLTYTAISTMLGCLPMFIITPPKEDNLA